MNHSWERNSSIKSLLHHRPVLLLAACFAILILLVSALLPSLFRPRETGYTPTELTRHGLKQWRLLFMMYAQDREPHWFPPRATGHDLWTPDLQLLVDDFLTEPRFVVSPRMAVVDKYDVPESVRVLAEEDSPDLDRLHAIMAENFIYTGYALLDAEAIRAFTAALREDPALDLEHDFKIGKTTFYRLREGIERFFLEETNWEARPAHTPSQLPVMFENSFRRDLEDAPRGAHVLYMDGRVEFIAVKDNPALFDALDELLALYTK